MLHPTAKDGGYDYIAGNIAPIRCLHLPWLPICSAFSTPHHILILLLCRYAASLQLYNQQLPSYDRQVIYSKAPQLMFSSYIDQQCLSQLRRRQLSSVEIIDAIWDRWHKERYIDALFQPSIHPLSQYVQSLGYMVSLLDCYLSLWILLILLLRQLDMGLSQFHLTPDTEVMSLLLSPQSVTHFCCFSSD